jgi:hypothetical protein
MQIGSAAGADPRDRLSLRSRTRAALQVLQRSGSHLLKLRVVQPGREAVVHEFAGDAAVVGRAPDCDVRIPESYVSKRHAKVLFGLVLVDLGSSNGTHVDGRRIEEPVLLTGRSFKLGTEAGDAVVEVEHLGVAPGAGDKELRQAREDLDVERRRTASLVHQLSELRAAARARPEAPAGELAALRTELADAKRRLESLRSEVEERDVSASEGIQVRLAQEQLAELRDANEALRRQVDALQGAAAGPAVEAARRALAARVAELEGERAELRARAEGLEAELRSVKAAAQPAGGVSDLFFRLQAENRELRERLEKAGTGVAAGEAAGSAGLFFELQAANAKLRGRVAELEAAAGRGAAPASGSAAVSGELEALREENHGLRMSKADLVAELDRLRHRFQAVPPPVIDAGSVGECAAVLFQALVDDDVEGHPPLIDGPHEPFVVLELFRFLRQIERLVTRMAGDFINLYDQRTILPDVAGNMRRLVGAVIRAPDDTRPRHDLISYFDELRKWLVVALGANRLAAERFAEEIRSDLSERSLTAAKPIPAIKKLTGGVDAELWDRASSYLKGLTADVVEERLQQLARRCAEELRRDQDRP